MKTLSIITISLLLLIGCNQAQNKTRSTANEKVPFMRADTAFNFDQCETGKLPVGWSEAFTGRGTGTRWEAVDDNGNKVLAQLSSDNPNYHFNVAVYDGFKVKDVELTVRMKGVDGHMDQGGGFVWRYIDADNYYVVRANPLEDNVVLYKVENGKRSDLPLIGKGRTYGTEVPALGNGWNNLKLTVIDDLFTVFLNGKQIFQVKDKTFTEAGKIGLWTKADAVSYFDDLEVKALK